MDDQDKNLSKSERAKDVAKTFVGMINYTDGAYDPDLTLDEFESEYKSKLKKAKPEEKSEIEELLSVISILGYLLWKSIILSKKKNDAI